MGSPLTVYSHIPSKNRRHRCLLTNTMKKGLTRAKKSLPSSQIIKSAHSFHNANTPPLTSNMAFTMSRGDNKIARTHSNSLMSGMQNAGTVEENLQDISATLRSRMNNITLTFFDKYVEMEYEKFFLSKNLVKWRRNLCVLFLSATAGYLYLMIKSPNDADEWVKGETAAEQWATGVAGNDTVARILRQTCGQIFICSTCNPNTLCNGYTVRKDILFWTMGILIPFLAVLFTSFKMQAVDIGRQVHLLSAVFTSLVTVIGIFIRWLIVEPQTPLYQTTYLSILSVTACFVFLRMRFIYSVLCCCVVVGSYLVTSFLSISTVSSYRMINSYFENLQIAGNHYNSLYTLALSVLALLAVTGIVSCSCFDTEVFYRGQFLVSHTLQKHNAKLTNQLKVLQKCMETRLRISIPRSKKVL
ncbi:hypothetical protein BC829DRAFT_31799 [Chytridium lagenaria]|nr:hypothetical protein BC829DRAFT_31799 [Chytridium lagenaria]